MAGTRAKAVRTAVSTPAVRGIYACSYLVYPEARTGTAEQYRRFYQASPFVRVLDEPPNVIDVRGTNNADIYVQDGRDGVTVVIASVDNLVRGAAGQAVQCMNLSFGLPEDRGLRLAALVP